MPNLVQRLVASTKRRASRDARRGQRGRRTEALHDAALRLLAKHDYETISIAAIGREAGCSIGAFYGRFPDKIAFLQSVISVAFRTLTVEADHDLDPARWRGVSRIKAVTGLVRHVVLQLSRDQAAGATRAALKLATIKPEALEPLLQFRTAITGHAVALLAPRPSPDGATAAVRTAVQLIFATVIDGVLQNAGPLRPGSPQMVDTLSDLVTLSLKLPHRGSAEDRDDEARGVSRSGSVRLPATGPPPKEPGRGNALLSPEVRGVMRTPDVSRRGGRRIKGSDAAATHPSAIDPRRATAPDPIDGGDRNVRGRRRRFHVL